MTLAIAPGITFLVAALGALLASIWYTLKMGQLRRRLEVNKREYSDLTHAMQVRDREADRLIAAQEGLVGKLREMAAKPDLSPEASRDLGQELTTAHEMLTTMRTQLESDRKETHGLAREWAEALDEYDQGIDIGSGRSFTSRISFVAGLVAGLSSLLISIWTLVFR